MYSEELILLIMIAIFTTLIYIITVTIFLHLYDNYSTACIQYFNCFGAYLQLIIFSN